MPHHIYTTEGLVLSSRPTREADRVYAILTRDQGLVRARALGVRKSASKLRGALEPFALVTVSLVRGREEWRITAAEQAARLPSTAELARPLALLEKLIAGEEAHPALFDAVALHLRSSDFDEPHLVAEILYHLGYLRREDLALRGPALVEAINYGIRESGLG